MNDTKPKTETDRKILYPTKYCFNDALELIDYAALHEPEVLPAWRLVHAICEMPDGTRYAHGWVEDHNLDVAIFSGILDGELTYMYARISDYREHLKVIDYTEYTVKEIAVNNLRSGHYGPWEKKYQDLAGPVKHEVMDGRPLACGKLGTLTKKENNKQ